MTARARQAGRRRGPIRVAIIGGGCAAMAAAFELSRPEHRGRYKITVYQVGHRLGGKGASGRGAHGRIEEHGLHLWLGFYENAFRLMRRVYDELDRDEATCPIVDIETAFEPAAGVGLTERVPGGFRPWIALFPTWPEMPGGPFASLPAGRFTVAGYLERAAELLIELIRSAGGERDPRGHGSPARSASRDGEEAAGGAEDPLVEVIDRLLKYGQLATMTAVLEAAELLRRGFAELLPDGHRSHDPLLSLCAAIAALARRRIEVLAEADAELCRVWEVIDVLLTTVRGLLRDGIIARSDGFDSLDRYDYREWLRRHGATERALDGAVLRGIYDLLFAYEDGDVGRPRFAAGVAVRGLFRMFFTYKGSLFFRMTAGMGDVIFAPLYEVLRDRGVRFAFFHRLRNVRLAPESAVPPGEEPWVTGLDFDVQAHVSGGGDYDPLIPCGGLPCWPSRPKFELLEGGEDLEAGGADFESHRDTHCAEIKLLEVGKDFDLVVLATGLGAVPHVAGELVQRSERFYDLVTNVKTVATQAFQIWMGPDMRSLGWRGGASSVSGFVEPFDTWADMSHLLPREGWHEGSGTKAPRSIAYFCSVLADRPGEDEDGYEEARRAEVKESALRFLRRDVRWLWPRAVGRGGEIKWEILAGGAAGQGPERFDAQYWRANVSPSDRYVMSLPGTVRYRISPLDPGVANLTVAGDWTLNGLNSSCVESAVMSGMLAAHALSGSPPLEEIIGYDHP